jgi:hypothetical protein
MWTAMALALPMQAASGFQQAVLPPFRKGGRKGPAAMALPPGTGACLRIIALAKLLEAFLKACLDSDKKIIAEVLLLSNVFQVNEKTYNLPVIFRYVA